MNGKVIKREGDTVTIGFEDGTCKDVTYKKLGFRAVIGDEIEVFSNEDGTVYSKKSETYGRNDPVKRVNKVAYLVLTFFLGGFGIHKFYAGRFIKGILYLVFCWTFLPALLALIEFVLVLFRKADPNGNILV